MHVHTFCSPISFIHSLSSRHNEGTVSKMKKRLWTTHQAEQLASEPEAKWVQIQLHHRSCYWRWLIEKINALFLSIVVWFLCSKGDDNSHENLIDWGNLFEFPQLVFVLCCCCWCYIQWAFDAKESCCLILSASLYRLNCVRFLFGVVGYIRIQDNSARFDPAFGKTTIENMISSRCERGVSETNRSANAAQHSTQNKDS